MAIAIEMYRGDDREVDFFVTDAAGSVVDISLWTNFRFAVKRSKGDADVDALFILTVGSGLAVLSASGGQVRGTIDHALTSGLAARRQKFWCGFQGLDPTGKVKTPDEGTLTVLTDTAIATS